MMSAREVARALGGEVTGHDRVSAPGPGHKSPKDRSLSVRLDPGAPDGFVIYSHSGDDWKTCRDYVRDRLGLPRWEPGDGQRRAVPPSRIAKWDLAAIEDEAQMQPRTEDDLDRIARALAIWSEAADPRGTVAEQYLRSRALDLPDDLAGTVLRFHPRCPWRDEDTGQTTRIPALTAAFRCILEDDITGIHRIRLDQPQRWPKTERRMLGLTRHAAIKLAPSDKQLAIGEGVETCMAARQLGLSRPVWALGSVGAISFFPVIEGVRRLTILREAGEASRGAVQICTKRWQGARRHVTANDPDNGLSDLNDELIAKQQRAI
jgi:hypothetical protein